MSTPLFSWVLNEQITFGWMLERLFWDFKSVITEDLIFRGALLFIVIRKLGANTGLFISTTAFGEYHWFSFGIFGNIIPMIFVFTGTALMGHTWAVAYLKTESILMPIGLHLGWNFTFNTIFSRGPLRQGVLLTQGGEKISDWLSLIGLLLAPIIILGVVKICIPREAQTFKKRNLNTTNLEYKVLDKH